MTNTLLLNSWFFWPGFATFFIIGLICLIIGLVVGWLAWRHCGVQADRLERTNEELRQNYSKLKANRR